jgi:Tol biopolymer transport system component
MAGTRAQRPPLLNGFRSDVYWWEPDGRVVRVSPGDGIYLMACIHPDGGHVVLWGGTRGRPRLWVADGAGGFDALTDGTRSARFPAYSVNGRLLAYTGSLHPSETMERFRRDSSSTGRPDPAAGLSIVVRRTEDGREHDVTDGSYRDERPALSPDGKLVAFISNRLRDNGLWVASTDGLTPPRPLVVDRGVYRPWWSVDGKRIFFFTFAHRHQIHYVPAAGGAPVPLANDDRGLTRGPYADPRGRHLIVHSTREARPDGNVWSLFELPLDGRQPRRLTPPGVSRASHGTRARNGVVTFDVSGGRS